jgi:3-dehydroquinate dehydratase-1
MDELRHALKGVDRAEIRLERLAPTDEQLKEIFALPVELVATMRPGQHNDEARAHVLSLAAASGAAYVDVELDSPAPFREKVVAACRHTRCRVIVSFHDFEKTPEREALRDVVEDSFAAGGDVAKVACLARSPREAARLLALLDDGRPIIAIGMGPWGTITRLAAPLLGSPFTYAAPAAGKETAPGQLTVEQLQRLLGEVHCGPS